MIDKKFGICYNIKSIFDNQKKRNNDSCKEWKKNEEIIKKYYDNMDNLVIETHKNIIICSACQYWK